MARFAKNLIEEKRRELESMGGVEKFSRRKGGDFLTLLVEANLGNLLPEGQRLSDEEIIDGTTLVTSFLPLSDLRRLLPHYRMHNVSL